MAHRESWNEFVRHSKNGTFLFDREYMEYHADRFVDASALIYRDDDLVALFPASRHDDRLISHGGLTYGGIVSGSAMKTALMLEVFESIAAFARQIGIRRVSYKAVPRIYHAMPADEDLYALFRQNAELVRRDVSAALEPRKLVELPKGRKAAIKRAVREGVLVRESTDFVGFMALEASHLQEKFGVTPVHSPEEMRRLAASFPENIRLFGAFLGEELVAGTIIYESARVAHTQYIASTDAGRAVSALDLVLHSLITDVYADKAYFDFGISTEDGGRVLNAGLAANKESYGARATVYDFYEWRLA